jgi:hypothetical protein
MWYIINLTKNEKVFQMDNFFTFSEITHFLKSTGYWCSSDNIIITNTQTFTEYIGSINDNYIMKSAIKPFVLDLSSFTEILFSLELMISIEEYIKINKTLQLQFANIDLKRLC